RVLALDVPGPSIRVMPGSAAVRNRGNGAPKEMYAVELQGSADTVSVSSTDASGGRSDLVVVRVENPFIPGEPFGLPTEPTEGPCTHVRISYDVPSDCTDYYDLEPGTCGGLMVSDTDSVLTLARIDIPESTGTITQDMLNDLRSMGQLGGRRIGEDFFAEVIWTEASILDTETVAGTGTSFTNWPNKVWQVPIPEWVTGAVALVLFNPKLTDGNVWGEMKIDIGGADFGLPTTYDFDFVGTNTLETMFISGTYVIPPEVRGTVANIRLRQRSMGTYPGRLRTGVGTYVYIQLAFKRNPVFH